MTERLTFAMADSLTLLLGGGAAVVSAFRFLAFGGDLAAWSGLVAGSLLVAWSFGYDLGLRLFFFRHNRVVTALGLATALFAGSLVAAEELSLSALSIYTLLSAAVLVAGWRVSATKTPYVPAVFFMLVLTASYAGFTVVSDREAVRTRASLIADIDAIRSDIQGRIQFEFSPLVHLVNQYESENKLDREAWEKGLRAYLAECSPCNRIVWRDGLQRVRWDSSGGPTTALTANQRELYELVRQLGRGFLLDDPKRAAHELVLPLMPGRWFDGYLTLEFRAGEWLNALLGPEVHPGFALQILDGTKELFARIPAEIDRGEFFSDTEPLALETFGSGWEIRIRPSHAEVARRHSAAGWYVLLGGILLAFTLSGLLHAVLVARAQAAQQARVNLDLAESEARHRREAEENETAREKITTLLRDKTEFLEAVARELASLASALVPTSAAPAKTARKSKKAKTPPPVVTPESVASVRKRLDGLSAEIRDLAGATEGRYESRPVDSFDVRELVESVATVLRPLAQASGATLQLAMPSTLPPGTRGDRDRITLALIHAGQESIDAAGAGKVTILVDTTLSDRRLDLQVQIDITPEPGRARGEPLGGRLLAEYLDTVSGKVLTDTPSRLIFRLPLDRGETVQKPSPEDAEMDLDEIEEDPFSERLIQLISEEIPLGFERIRGALITDEWASVRQNCQVLAGALEELGAEDVIKLLKPLAHWSPEDGAPAALTVLAAIEAAFDDFCDQLERESLRVSRAA